MHETITWIKYGCGLPECGGRYLIQTTAVYGSVFEGMLFVNYHGGNKLFVDPFQRVIPEETLVAWAEMPKGCNE